MTGYPFRCVAIIFNPNSTGDSKSDAVGLKKELEGRLNDDVKVELVPTDHAGHAEEIAKSYAEADEKTLLISASGDGGYNEVVNGIVNSSSKNLAVAVLPSGNANDHYHTTAKEGLLGRILKSETRLIDVLEVSAVQKGKLLRRYAHSYVGVGMTAYIGEKLTQADLNPVKEKWLVAKYLLKFGRVWARIGDDDNWRDYSNLIAANIDRMSKVISLYDKAKLDDGHFELYIVPSGSLTRLLKTLLAGVVIGLEPQQVTSEVELILKKDADIQCDGEVFRVDGGQPIKIRCLKQTLRTLA